MFTLIHLWVLYAFVVLLAVATGHFALYREPSMWPAAVLFVGWVLVCGFVIIDEYLGSMKLPKIAALDLRAHAVPRPANDIEPAADAANLPLFQFPAGWGASS